MWNQAKCHDQNQSAVNQRAEAAAWPVARPWPCRAEVRRSYAAARHRGLRGAACWLGGAGLVWVHSIRSGVPPHGEKKKTQASGEKTHLPLLGPGWDTTPHRRSPLWVGFLANIISGRRFGGFGKKLQLCRKFKIKLTCKKTFPFILELKCPIKRLQTPIFFDASPNFCPGHKEKCRWELRNNSKKIFLKPWF